VEKDKAVSFAILSAVFSSLAIVIVSVGAHSGINPILFTALSGIIGSVFLLVLMKMGRERLTLAKIRRNWHDILGSLAFRGLLGTSILYVGLGITTGIEAIFFTKMEPYFVMFLDWITGKVKIRRYHVALLSIHLAGVFLLATGGSFSLSHLEFGDLLIIFAVFCFAVSYRYGKRMSRNIGPKGSVVLTNGLGSIILLPIGLLISGVISHGLGSTAWLFIITNAALSYVLSITLWFASLKETRGWIVSALRAVGPVAIAPVAFLFFGQTLGAGQIVGAGIIVVTAFLIAREHV